MDGYGYTKELEQDIQLFDWGVKRLEEHDYSLVNKFKLGSNCILIIID